MKFTLTLESEKGTTIEVEARTPKLAVKKLFPNAKIFYGGAGPYFVKVSDGNSYTIMSVINR